MAALGRVVYRQGAWWRQGKLGQYRLARYSDTSGRNLYPDPRCEWCARAAPHSEWLHWESCAEDRVQYRQVG